jgi:hypothetical protein
MHPSLWTSAALMHPLTKACVTHSLLGILVLILRTSGMQVAGVTSQQHAQALL